MREVFLIYSQNYAYSTTKLKLKKRNLYYKLKTTHIQFYQNLIGKTY